MNGMMRAAMAAVLVTCAVAADPWLTFAGGKGPGKGKHIVLISGDEEYRSEEAMPQLGRILAERHGFKTTVLFAIDPDGTVNPENRKNIPGLEALRTADLMIVATRYRQLPDEQMKLWDEYVHSGKPMMGLRTATHAFAFDKDVETSYRQWDNRDKGEWPGGFGKQVLGETWVSHHGKHKVQSTRGVIAPGMEKHPVLRGVKDVWGPTDVYTVRALPEGTTTLLLGQVLTGMNPTDGPAEGKLNDPMMPLAWVRTFTTRTGKQARVFTTTMGASVDLVNEDLRRLVVNAAYWAVGLEKKIPARADVRIVGVYEPTFYGFGKHRRGLRPEEYAK